jgi:6-hydroxy-3-succinoylpyridine 3-monooxygenase
MSPTTNPQCRRGLSIWSAGEKAGESRFFHFRGEEMREAVDDTPLKTRVYIDGYNLYYGCLKNTPYKWLDILSLFERYILPSILATRGGKPRRVELLPLAIKYFTAQIMEQSAKAHDSVSSQARYHNALRKRHDGRIKIIEGYYSLIEAKAKIVDAENPRKWPRDCQEILVWKLEEKQSDVNLALNIYHDAISGEVDHVVVVTNDTDIAPALQMVRDHTKATVGLVVPTREQERVPNVDLAKLSHWVRKHIGADELAACQLPRVIPGRKPTIKPESWYARPDLLERVLQGAIPIAGSRSKAFKWMEETNDRLKGKAPIDLVETDEGAAVVMQYIQDYIAYQAVDE